MKNLNKKEQESLVICRERVVDALMRVAEIEGLLQKKGWMEGNYIGSFKEFIEGMDRLREKLTAIETAVFALNQREGGK